MSSLEEICSELSSLKSAVITAHVSPDTDAVGSSCGLALGLRKLGIKADVYLYDTVPEIITPLIKGIDVLNAVPKDSYSAVVVVDTATRKRVGKDYERLFKQGEKVINIDHHISNDGWGDVNYIDAKAAASAEIVFSILKQLDVEIDPDMADLLYAGVADDTGLFRYSNTTPNTLSTVAKLVGEGARIAELSNHLYFSVPKRVIQLRGACLSKLETFLDGKVGLLIVTQEMLKAAGATSEDTEGLVDEVRSIKGTVAAVFMRELEDRKAFKLSLRSKVDALNVNEIALMFDGGGHRGASGCTIEGDLDTVKETILRVVTEKVAEL